MKFMRNSVAIIWLALALCPATRSGSAFAQSLPQSWQDQQLASLMRNDPDLASLNITPKDLNAEPQDLTTSLNDGFGHPVTDSRNCNIPLNIRGLHRSIEGVFQKRNHLWRYNNSDERNIVIFSIPERTSSHISFYSYIAAISACDQTCHVTIEAKGISIPIENGRIEAFDPQRDLVEDTFVGALINATQTYINGCT